jgi:hypothetical protein
MSLPLSPKSNFRQINSPNNQVQASVADPQPLTRNPKSTPQDWRCLAVRHVPLRPTTSPLHPKVLPVSGKYHVCLGPPAQPMKHCFARKRDPTIWCHIKADICLPNSYLSLLVPMLLSPYPCGHNNLPGELPWRAVWSVRYDGRIVTWVLAYIQSVRLIQILL